MRRYEILDGFRGYFLVFMMVNHLIFQGGSVIQKINHQELGFVQDAQGFIFISGLIAGIHYGRGYLAGKDGATDRKLTARARLLYVYTLAVLGAVFLAAWLVPNSRDYWVNYFGHLYESPQVTTLSAALLLYQPTFMDILPQYVLYLLATPLLLRWILRGHAAAVLTGSLLLWLAVQLALYRPIVDGVAVLGAAIAPGFVPRAHFNPLAWQLVFVAGLLIGAKVAQGRPIVARWFAPDRQWPVVAALVVVLVFMGYRLGFSHGLISERLAEPFRALDFRGDFSLIYVANFAAMAYLVTWLVVCGHAAGSPLLRRVGAGLRALFELRFLRFLGQHSLQVYAFHVVVAYLVILLDGAAGPFSEPTKTVITILAILSLLIPAWLHARRGPAAARRPLSTTEPSQATAR